VTSKYRFGDQRAASAASSYHGLPRCDPWIFSFGKERAMVCRNDGRMRAIDDCSGSPLPLPDTMPVWNSATIPSSCMRAYSGK
jgi:hypothetical protein